MIAVTTISAISVTAIPMILFLIDTLITMDGLFEPCGVRQHISEMWRRRYPLVTDWRGRIGSTSGHS